MLARRLAVGGDTAVAVLRREGDALTLKKCVYLVGIGGGMETAIKDLSLSRTGVFLTLQLLDLGDEVAFPPDPLRIRELRARARI